MSRLLRRTLALFLLSGALPLGLDEAVAGTPPANTASAPASPGPWPQHDLSALRNFAKVLIYVKDNYAAPKRVKPKEMAIAALEAVEQTVPDVLVDGNASTGRLEVTVGDKKQDFDISRADNLWKMSFLMKDVFGFISKNMRPMEDTREVELAAINGMLATLDSRSVLIRPEEYSTLKKASEGRFGSIGIVLQMKEGIPTLVRALPGLPAAKAGLQKGDQLKKIGEESTGGMGLGEVMSKLRGPVDSKVTLTVERKGWDTPRELVLDRGVIHIPAVRHKLLDQNVGYVRLSNLNGTATTQQLRAALQKLGQEAGQGGLKGLVLDLRGNPGGLLEQAIAVSDVFLSEGTIVTAVGLGGKLREEKRARQEAGEAGDHSYPLAVLVDGATASGSEVVAGALKNLDRAVIIGRRTFGMGSVSVLYDYPDGSALKLTIARLLTSGSVPIEGAGIVPDIELQPIRATRERVALSAPGESVGKEILEFGKQVVARRENPPASGAPAERLAYLETGSREESLDAGEQEALQEDFEVLFARDFVLEAPSVKRGEMVRRGKDYVEQRRREEEERIHASLAALGLDWSPGPTPKTPDLAVTLKPGEDRKPRAGELLELEVEVENKGAEPVKRLSAWTECPDNSFLDGREFLFGAVNPGERKSWKVSVPLPKGLSSRRDVVTVRLRDGAGVLPQAVTAELDFVEAPRPAFAFSWQVQDPCEACNGDGLVERGETVDVRVDITNTGMGDATGAFAQLKSLSGEDLLITQGHAVLGDLTPGATATARFQLEVKEGYTPDTFALKLFIRDGGKTYTTAKWALPVRREAPRVEAHEAVVRLGKMAELFSAPEEGAALLARLPRGAVVRQVARVGGFAKVKLDEDRFAFVKAQDAKGGSKLKLAPVKGMEPAPARGLPRISFSGVEPAQGGPVTSEERFTLSGTLAPLDGGPVVLYALVNGQKVFFQALAPSEGGPEQAGFSTGFALKEGLNHVEVVVAQDGRPDILLLETLAIRRRPAGP